MAAWAGQHFSLADWRRSPLATSRTVFDFFMMTIVRGLIELDILGGKFARYGEKASRLLQEKRRIGNSRNWH
jgi:hypothetical protein